MQGERQYGATGYWYPERNNPSGVDLLNELRRYRAAENAMRSRTRASMRMNETDLEAVRFLLREQRADRPVNATQLAAHLGITSASTSALVRRLVASGHISRRIDPSDRRGTLLSATGGSDEEVRSTLTGMHARMIIAAERLSSTTIVEMSAFLRGMSAAMTGDDHAARFDQMGTVPTPVSPIDADRQHADR